MVRLPLPHLPHLQGPRHRPCHAASGHGPIDLCAHRTRGLFHLHDRRRGRREEGRLQEIPGCLSAGLEGELHGLAPGADIEFQDGADPVSDSVCEYGGNCLDGVSELDEFGGRGID